MIHEAATVRMVVNVIDHRAKRGRFLGRLWAPRHRRQTAGLDAARKNP
jgi:hypothetical protein